MLTLLIFIAVLAILVLSHEFGHFVFARLFGMKVEEFGFGFPPRLLGIRRKTVTPPHGHPPAGVESLSPPSQGGTQGVLAKRWQIVWGNKNVKALEKEESLPGGTVYSFNWLPLGGFVKIKGEDGGTSDQDSFAAKAWWKKSVVLVAGVGMNILVGVVLISLGYMVGLPTALDGIKDVSKIADRHVEVVQILPGKPAAAAGIVEGDRIVAVGALNNPRLDELRAYVDAHKDETIPVTIIRGPETIIKQIHPTVYADTGKGGLGVGIVELGTVRFPWYQAIARGAVTTVQYLKTIITSFYYLLKDLFSGAGLSAGVSGPVGIAVMTGHVARLGWVYLTQFIAMLSLNLAVLNILPIPALDGGRLLFVIIGKIFRRPIKTRYEQLAHAIGFALLLLLVVAVTVKDLGTFKGLFVEAFNKIF